MMATDLARNQANVLACRWVLSVALLCAGCCSGLPVLAQGGAGPTAPAPAGTNLKAQGVLILLSQGFGGPGVDQYATALVGGLVEQGLPYAQVHTEYLGLDRDLSAGAKARLRAFLLEKYASRRIDLVIAMQSPALDFLLKELGALAPAASVAAVYSNSVLNTVDSPRKIVVKTATLDYAGTLQRALELFPATQRVMLFVGAGAADKVRLDGIRAQLRPVQGNLQVEDTYLLSLQDAQKKLAALPPHSIIMGYGYTQDVNGQTTVPVKSVEALAKVANAPIFMPYEGALGHGELGGMATSAAKEAAAMARQAVELLVSPPTQRLTVDIRPAKVFPTFDWQAVRRWHGAIERLPADTVFVNKPASLWGQYREYVVTTSLAMVLMALLILALLVQSRRRQLAQASLRVSEERFRALTAMATDFYWETDAEHRFTRRSDSQGGNDGADDRAHQFLGRCLWEIPYLAPDEAGWRTHRARLDARLPFRAFEVSRQDEKGGVRHLTVNGEPVFDAQGTFTGYRGTASDITARKLAEAELRIAASAFESQQNMMITAADRTILRVNQAFTANTGYTAAELVGQTPDLFRSGAQDLAAYQAVWASAQRHGLWRGELWVRRKNDEQFLVWLEVSAVRDEHGTATHYIYTHSDMTERDRTRERINRLAYFDQLTGLPNRALVLERLQQALSAAEPGGQHGALLFVDLDQFQKLNDTLGHEMGDQLLKVVAQRLSACVSEADTVARLGGDEFVLLLPNLGPGEEEAAARSRQIADNILAAVGKVFHLGDGEHHCTASIGATLFSGQQCALDALMKQADLAMYRAKASGRNVIRYFDPSMEAELMARAALESDMRRALAEQQFVLHYQAQVVAAGRITGAEVLVRWRHPQRGMVSPAEFIPMAEETGLILPLGEWVLQAACRQLALWAAQPDLAALTVAVNVSALQFHQPDFVARVLAVLGDTGANPHRLKLELTESLLVSNVEDIIEKMFALKAKGVGFSLDDFGTGFSSLTYLKRLPLDQLKIDQSFVRDVLVDPNDSAIAKTIVGLAQSLGLGVIAEGVETAAQRDFLAQVGCHAYQGYFFSRPVACQDFELLVRRG